MTEEEFDWDNDPSVILRDQAAVAAYYNGAGELVVRQRDTMGSEAVLFVAPENIETLLKGLADRAEHGERPAGTSLVQPSTRLTVIKGGAE